MCSAGKCLAQGFPGVPARALRGPAGVALHPHGRSSAPIEPGIVEGRGGGGSEGVREGPVKARPGPGPGLSPGAPSE